MGSIWAKIDALLPMNPKGFDAAWWGCQIFANLLLINKAHGCDGLIPVRFVRPEYLARYLQMDTAKVIGPHAVELVKHGLEEAKRAELIRITADGVEILGWDRKWGRGADSSTERTRKWREKQREQQQDGESALEQARALLEQAGMMVMAPGDGDASQRHSDGVTVRIEQNRSDQIRTDKDLPDAQSAPVEKPKAKAKKRKGLDPDKIPNAAHLAAQVLADYVIENNPDGKLAAMPEAKRQAAILKSADAIRLANKEDGLSWGKIDAMIEWSQNQKFWAPLVQDGAKRRKHWDTMAGQRNGTVTEDVKVGRVEPAPHSAHQGGEVEL
jgi:hypothetical protein